eukprot:sb/3464716/
MLIYSLSGDTWTAKEVIGRDCVRSMDNISTCALLYLTYTSLSMRDDLPNKLKIRETMSRVEETLAEKEQLNPGQFELLFLRLVERMRKEDGLAGYDLEVVKDSLNISEISAQSHMKEIKENREKWEVQFQSIFHSVLEGIKVEELECEGIGDIVESSFSLTDWKHPIYWGKLEYQVNSLSILLTIPAYQFLPSPLPDLVRDDWQRVIGKLPETDDLLPLVWRKVKQLLDGRTGCEQHSAPYQNPPSMVVRDLCIPFNLHRVTEFYNTITPNHRPLSPSEGAVISGIPSLVPLGVMVCWFWDPTPLLSNLSKPAREIISNPELVFSCYSHLNWVEWMNAHDEPISELEAEVESLLLTADDKFQAGTDRKKQTTNNQNSLFRSRDWLSANQGLVFPDSVLVVRSHNTRSTMHVPCIVSLSCWAHLPSSLYIIVMLLCRPTTRLKF